ncbi:MAG: hypothetical protein WCY09_08250 [Candidatus Omnitrophota bacterium]|jgi:hypothetical protein
MKATKQQKADALARIQALVKPGDTLYTKVEHVSRSGMLRVVTVYAMKDNEPINISGSLADLCGFAWDYNNDGFKVSGCGMDVGFEAVYNLACVLFPDGFDCTGENCPSNDHTNGMPRTAGVHHHSGGYALRQSWL